MADYILSALQQSGELEIGKNRGPRGTNRYRLRFDAMGQGVQHVAGVQSFAGMQCIARTPATHCTKPLQPIADEPSLNRQEPSGSEPSASDADASRSMSAKEKVWLLGPAVLGEKARPLLGKLAKQYGEDVVADVLSAATTQMPLMDAKAWVVAACEGRKSARQGANDPLSNPTPPWAINAGFSNRFEAENEGCFEHNAKAFKNGRRRAA